MYVLLPASACPYAPCAGAWSWLSPSARLVRQIPLVSSACVPAVIAAIPITVSSACVNSMYVFASMGCLCPVCGCAHATAVERWGIRSRVPELFAIVSVIPVLPVISEFRDRAPGLFVSVPVTSVCPEFACGRGAEARYSLGAPENSRNVGRVGKARPRPGEFAVANGGGCVTADGAEVLRF